MKVVALLGPSGVGKTFLYERLFNTLQERAYLNVREACIKAAVNLKPRFDWNRRYLYYRMLKSGLFDFKAYGLARRSLAADRLWSDHSEFYSVSLDLLNTYLKSEDDAAVYKRRVENFNRCIQLDLVLESRLNADDLVLFDEGTLHHHHGLNAFSIEPYTAEAIKEDRALNPFAVISCELPLEKNLERIKRRRIQGLHTFSHQHLSDAELATYVAENNAAYRLKLDWLKTTGIPFLILNTENSISQNVQDAHSFLNNLN